MGRQDELSGLKISISLHSSLTPPGQALLQKLQLTETTGTLEAAPRVLTFRLPTELVRCVLAMARGEQRVCDLSCIQTLPGLPPSFQSPGHSN